ncbi:MAG: ASCH domain-containing protein [Nanoarchaeota archaeon]
MKALSIKQPFAELILEGKKKIELRKWNTNFRGEFLIHASKTPDEKVMKEFNFADLPCGAIVGKVNLVGVKHYKNELEHKADNDKHLASSFWGDFGFILESPKRLEKPIPAKGNLNFWEFNGRI